MRAYFDFEQRRDRLLVTSSSGLLVADRFWEVTGDNAASMDGETLSPDVFDIDWFWFLSTFGDKASSTKYVSGLLGDCISAKIKKYCIKFKMWTVTTEH